jgi:hypothetical protein
MEGGALSKNGIGRSAQPYEKKRKRPWPKRKG